MKAVKVRVARQTYNSFIKKHFRTYESHLVSDPTSSLRTGDVVRILPHWRTSRHISHVVSEILAPFGVPIDERPMIMSEEERVAKRAEKRAAKEGRRARRRMEGSEGDRKGRNDGEDEGLGAGAIDERARGNQARARRMEAKGRENEAEAEGVQAELDEKGVGVDDVRRRLEGVKI